MQLLSAKFLSNRALLDKSMKLAVQVLFDEPIFLRYRATQDFARGCRGYGFKFTFRHLRKTLIPGFVCILCLL